MIKRQSFPAYLAALLACMALCPQISSANPKDGKVAAGQAQISGSGTKLNVFQATDKAIINWQSFNIDPDEHVQFHQPSNRSVTLNRVTGREGRSEIFGRLSANGKIMLVNPDGALIGPNAQIDVAGLLVTSNDIRNEDFLTGRYLFDIPGKASASIVNMGNISVADHGIAALVAPAVRNSGIIKAKLGKISLAAANAFTLDLYGDELVKLKIDDRVLETAVDAQTGAPVRDLVKNEGKLSADGGHITLSAASARAAVDNVINTTGIVEARTISTLKGKIILGAQTAATKHSEDPKQGIRISGKIDVSAVEPKGVAGIVAVTGEAVALSGTIIDATGAVGGGIVLVGGNLMGGQDKAIGYQAYPADPISIGNASDVSVNAETAINISATESGHAGHAIVWADDTTRFLGTIDARGGTDGGDGGFVEVSGARRLVLGGQIDRSAANGSPGTLLIDPTDVIVTTASDPDPDDDITFVHPNLLRSGSTTIFASDDIFFLSDIIGSGNVSLFAGDNIRLQSFTGQTLFAVAVNSIVAEELKSTDTMYLSARNISATSITSDADVMVTWIGNNDDALSLPIDAPRTIVMGDASLTINSLNSLSPSIDVSAARDITVASQLDLNTDSFLLSSDRHVYVNAPVTSSGDLQIFSPDITINATATGTTADFRMTSLTVSGALNFTEHVNLEFDRTDPLEFNYSISAASIALYSTSDILLTATPQVSANSLLADSDTEIVLAGSPPSLAELNLNAPVIDVLTSRLPEHTQLYADQLNLRSAIHGAETLSIITTSSLNVANPIEASHLYVNVTDGDIIVSAPLVAEDLDLTAKKIDVSANINANSLWFIAGDNIAINSEINPLDPHNVGGGEIPDVVMFADSIDVQKSITSMEVVLVAEAVSVTAPVMRAATGSDDPFYFEIDAQTIDLGNFYQPGLGTDYIRLFGESITTTHDISFRTKLTMAFENSIHLGGDVIFAPLDGKGGFLSLAAPNLSGNNIRIDGQRGRDQIAIAALRPSNPAGVPLAILANPDSARLRLALVDADGQEPTASQLRSVRDLPNAALMASGIIIDWLPTRPLKPNAPGEPEAGSSPINPKPGGLATAVNRNGDQEQGVIDRRFLTQTTSAERIREKRAQNQNLVLWASTATEVAYIMSNVFMAIPRSIEKIIIFISGDVVPNAAQNAGGLGPDNFAAKMNEKADKSLNSEVSPNVAAENMSWYDQIGIVYSVNYARP